MTFLLYTTEGILNTYDISNAITYIKRYTRIQRGELTIWANPSVLSHTIDDIHAWISDQENPHNSMAIGVSKNQSALFHNTKKFQFPSFVILPDFDQSKELQKYLVDLPLKLLRHNIWIICLSLEYNDELQISKFLHGLILKYPRYIGKFVMNSKIFALTKNNQSSHLFELYQMCNTSHLSAFKLTSLANTSYTDAKYIWDNRKNLDRCLIRFGYFKDGSFLGHLRISNENKSASDAFKYEKLSITSDDIIFYGYFIQLLSVFQAKLNFSIKFIPVEDQRFGSFDENLNEWDGIIGMIKRNEIDTSPLHLSITPERR